MVEQEAVNFEVAGSSPAVGAKMIMHKDLRTEGLFVCYNSSMNKPSVLLNPEQAAKDLWDFGEDMYIKQALALKDDELTNIGEQIYSNFNGDFYKKGGKKIPEIGNDIGFVSAMTLVEYFEGEARPLKRFRRRNQDIQSITSETNSHTVTIKDKIKRFIAKYIH
jgi:hypothetical protein